MGFPIELHEAKPDELLEQIQWDNMNPAERAIQQQL